MARISGRNLWIAIPAGVLCAGVVGALAWLSQPMIPVTVAWVGDTLRNATTLTVPEPAASRPAAFESAATSDCRALYPDGLWAELTWTPDALLSQNVSPPATTVEAIVEALAPEVRVTCTWRAPGDRTISTTVAAVSPEVAPIAEAAFVGAGFACDTSQGLTCSRKRGGVVEEQFFRDGMWISSVETAWSPKGYGARIAAHVWG